MAKYNNEGRIPLALAVWLATDSYDYNDDPFTISATTLLKPTKEIILSSRVKKGSVTEDIGGRLSSTIGTAIHDSIEHSWVTNYKQAMEDLGYPKKVIDKIRINPSEKEAKEDILPVYMEQRLSRRFGKWTVTGKFDFLAQGRVEDFKTTSVFTYINRTNDYKYKMQGSIYRALDPKKITEDVVMIHFLFLDWKAYEYLQNKSKYPPSKALPYPVALMDINETEIFIESKLQAIEDLYHADESSMPMCTREELWQDSTKFKYYKNPDKLARSTKNFDNLAEANLRLVEDGSVGIVLTVPGQVKACKYCSAYTECKQKDIYIQNGTLKI